MKKAIIGFLCALLLMFTVSNVKAASYDLTIGDAYTLGTVVPGIPASQFDNYLNNLLQLPGPYPAVSADDSNVYTRFLAGNLPDPVYPGVKTDTNSAPTITVDDNLYVAAKYDASNAGTVFWYLGGLNPTDTITLPQIWPNMTPPPPGYDISNYTLWEGSMTSVPEPATLLLLGLGLVSLATIRKKISK